MSLYDVVSKYASGLDMPIAKLERRAGISNGTVSKWNTASPSVANLQKVAEVLGVEVWRLIKESKEEQEK